MSDFSFITSDDKLAEACNQLSSQKIIAVDLEADSMYCFSEKICLIQIADREQAYLIDPFEISDMTPFIRVLESPVIIKVFHGSDFDVRSLDRQWQARIQNLFDTQIACKFLNIEKHGLGDLLEKFFQISVDKRFQKSNWARRPLPEDMIAYALTDVTRLIELHDILVEKLGEAKRLEWAKEECKMQTKVHYEDPHTPPLFKKFKGAGKLDKRSLAVLENLLLFRQDMARKKDLPLFKIMSNSAILEMTRLRPKNTDQLIHKKIFSTKQAGMYGNGCIEAIKQAMDIPDDHLPVYPKKEKQIISAQMRKCAKALKVKRQEISSRLQMDPGFVLNNKTISALCQGNPQDVNLSACGMKNWQIENFGKEILGVLEAYAK